MKPKGHTYLTETEKGNIVMLRKLDYTIKQIEDMTGRSSSTVKRLIYNW